MTQIYTLYDFDAGGERCARTIAGTSRTSPRSVHVQRLAVTSEQITQWGLPTRPAKQSDPEAKKHGAVAVELDAIPPDKLTALVDNAILSHVDLHERKVEQVIEKEEQAGLRRLATAA